MRPQPATPPLFPGYPATPAEVSPTPADRPVHARVERYLQLCQEAGEDPRGLVLAVSGGRTDAPAQLSAHEFENLARAWFDAHPAGAPATTGQARDGAHDTAPRPDAATSRRAAADPGEHPRAPRRARAELRGSARAGDGEPGSDTAGALLPIARASEPQERYVVGIGRELHQALRVHSARERVQMRAVTAEAVEQLLARLEDGEHPVLPERWRVATRERTRLAMRWPAGLADRLRACAVAQVRPAHELLALALLPVLDLDTDGGRR